jgi:hypothetical protein
MTRAFKIGVGESFRSHAGYSEAGHWLTPGRSAGGTSCGIWIVSRSRSSGRPRMNERQKAKDVPAQARGGTTSQKPQKHALTLSRTWSSQWFAVSN